MKNWLRRYWGRLIIGLVVVAVIAGVIGMVLSKEQGNEQDLVAQFNQLQTELEEEREQRQRENTRLWAENARLREEINRLPELSVERGVKFPSSEDWTDYLEARTGQRLEFLVRISSSNSSAHNVWVRAELPSLLIYKDKVKVDGVDFFGDITEGVNIGTVTSCNDRVITFEGQIATASQFPVGITSLTVSVEAWADCIQHRSSEITIVVERSARSSGCCKDKKSEIDAPDVETIGPE